jgi:dienelactone hydrolase
MAKHGMSQARSGGPLSQWWLAFAVGWLGLLSVSTGGCAAATGIPLSYHVGAKEEYATLYVPSAAVAKGATGRGPAVILLHGGFFGDDKPTRAMARKLARMGVLVAVPSYRGEKRGLDGERGQGKIDFCGGEVRDALVLQERLRERPDVDPGRIGLIGFSHGGCIALRTAESDPTVRAVVTYSAPTEAAYTYQHLRDHPLALFGFAGWLGGRLQAWVGGDPQTLPREWAERSPLYGPLPRMPLVLIHGTADHIVPVEETCWMRDALRKQGRQVTEHYFDRDGREVAPYPVCDRKPGVPGVSGVMGVMNRAEPVLEDGGAPAQVCPAEPVCRQERSLVAKNAGRPAKGRCPSWPPPALSRRPSCQGLIEAARRRFSQQLGEPRHGVEDDGDADERQQGDVPSSLETLEAREAHAGPLGNGALRESAGQPPVAGPVSQPHGDFCRSQQLKRQHMSCNVAKSSITGQI